MKKTKSILPLMLILPLFLAMFLVDLNPPGEAYARPLAGFTPSPPDPPEPPEPPEPPDSGTTDTDQGHSGGSGPTNFVYVQMDRCDFACSANFAQRMPESEFEPLVSMDSNPAYGPLLIPHSEAAPAVEVQAPVQLVHEGSGFIVAGTLSDRHGTRFAVPYGGHWEIWLTGSPQFVTDIPVDTTPTNLARLQSQLAEAPVALGMVEANTLEPQLVKCPIVCLVEAPPVDLPETGEDGFEATSLLKLLVLYGVSLALIGLIARRVARDVIANR